MINVIKIKNQFLPRTFYSLAIIILLVSCEGCDNDPKPKTELEKLPPATQEGKNTFGCLVNGKAWVTKTSIDAVAFYQEGVFQLGAQIEEINREQGIGLAKSFGIEEGVLYDFIHTPYSEAEFSWIRQDGICIYEPQSTLSGKMTITKLNQSNNIVSGVFEFTTVTLSCDTIRVTGGRFDLTYAN